MRLTYYHTTFQLVVYNINKVHIKWIKTWLTEVVVRNESSSNACSFFTSGVTKELILNLMVFDFSEVVSRSQ